MGSGFSIGSGLMGMGQLDTKGVRVVAGKGFWAAGGIDRGFG